MDTEHQIPIWFFIGVLLAIYGVLIFGAGLYGLYNPPDVKLAYLHVGVWWGVLLMLVGGYYTWRFWPWRQG